MCLALRNTESLSRPVSTGRRRRRRVRLARRSLRMVAFMFIPYPQLSACRRLTGLEAYDLTGVTDALAVVAVGRTDCADVSGDLAHQMLVDPADGDPGGFGGLDGDALRRLDHYVVREAHVEFEVLTLVLSAEAHAVDLEFLLEPFGDAEHGVVDERAGQTVLGAVATVVGGAADGQHAVLEAHVEPGAVHHFEAAFGALHGGLAGFDDLHFYAFGQVDGRAAYAAHHHTSQMISPPTLVRRASRSASRPAEVEITARPRPPRTTGACAALAYARRPGVETRWM